MEELRMKALAEHLDIDIEDIEPDTFPENSFIVNVHTKRRGTSPAKAKRLVDQLREVLKETIGEETESWTVDFLIVEKVKHDLAKHRMGEAELEADRLERSLPTIRSPYAICEKCDYISWKNRYEKCPKCLPRGKTKMILINQRRRVRMIDLDKMDKKLHRQAAPILKQIEWQKQKAAVEKEQVLLRYTYDNIMAIIQIKKPDALKVGIHDVANTLYYVTPRADNYESPSDHKETLREVFDRKIPEDRTEPYQSNDGEYQVLTDDEADELWDEVLDSYLDEIVLPEVPEHAQNYFDREGWKEDARVDGRGHSLNRYDGTEVEVTVDDEQFFIYRTN